MPATAHPASQHRLPTSAPPPGPSWSRRSWSRSACCAPAAGKGCGWGGGGVCVVVCVCVCVCVGGGGGGAAGGTRACRSTGRWLEDPCMCSRCQMWQRQQQVLETPAAAGSQAKRVQGAPTPPSNASRCLHSELAPAGSKRQRQWQQAAGWHAYAMAGSPSSRGGAAAALTRL